MPRFFHLADLHLGRVFHGESLLEDQSHILELVVTRVIEEQPDAVILAGDLFDRAVPPAGAMALLDEFMSSLADSGVAVAAIPGNHDSAPRLGYAAKAWERLGVHIRADYSRLNEPVRLDSRDGLGLDIFAMPFIETAALRSELDLETGDRLSLMRAALDGMKSARDSRRPAVLAAHEFVAGSAESGSERLYVGGSSSVPAELLDGFDYVALGHIHGAQGAGDAMIRYSGSPMAYSFDEFGREKGYMDVTLDPSQLYPEVRFCPLEPLHPLVIVEDSLENILSGPEYDQLSDSYISVRINDGLSHLNLIGRLREKFPLLREIRQLALESFGEREVNQPSSVETPQNLFADFLDFAGWTDQDQRTMAESYFHDAVSAGEGES
ncbi:MAG: exonuclease SbcCD subunit D [Spirochaetaceae bacterium]|nr:exonuclease SbcCD subunit D [Spirochaetaceae bacterium]MDT8297294.1 exonuclease SbcCD subunit D [Spirochaetaceae bacterium]